MEKKIYFSALINGVLLVFTCGVIATEAIYQLFSPKEIDAFAVMAVAAIGIFVNGTTACVSTWQGRSQYSWCLFAFVSMTP